MNNNKRNKHGRANQIKVETRDLTGQNDTHRPEGIYYPTVTVTDDKGNIYTDSIAITVLNSEKMDALLKGKWEGMKRALVDQDIEKVLSNFLGEARDRYREIFTLLASNLPGLAANIPPIEMVYVEEGVAQYRLRRAETMGDVTYYVYFARDGNGAWKIQQF